MKLLELAGQIIPVRDEVESVEEAMNRPLVDIKVPDKDLREHDDVQRLTEVDTA